MIILEIHNLSSQPAISNNFLPKVGVVAVIVGAIIAILFGTLALLHHSKSSQSVWAKTWSYQRWLRNDALRQHPCLVPYEQLPESEKDYDRHTAIATIQFILQQGFTIPQK
jgi:hypothetical protein